MLKEMASEIYIYFLMIYRFMDTKIIEYYLVSSEMREILSLIYHKSPIEILLMPLIFSHQAFTTDQGSFRHKPFFTIPRSR